MALYSQVCDSDLETLNGTKILNSRLIIFLNFWKDTCVLQATRREELELEHIVKRTVPTNK